ncbi:MAG: prepilin-type N-terminal cleavage/methylation domain-containing protein [Oleiphilaceae bacterium]|nr:prepilin-type N-terminal cleavage/methylation domain-containing protein [Oleiphilaceae bacterium]
MLVARSGKGEEGFTLIELVLVLILVGILSALGIGLLASQGAYSAGAARDQLVSSANLAAKLALSRSGDGASVRLTIEEDPSEWRFVVDPGHRVRTAQRHNATLSRPVSTLDYRADGQLASGDNLEFVFTGNSAHRACVLASGFAYAGACP